MNKRCMQQDRYENIQDGGNSPSKDEKKPSASRALRRLIQSGEGLFCKPFPLHCMTKPFEVNKTYSVFIVCDYNGVRTHTVAVCGMLSISDGRGRYSAAGSPKSERVL